MLSVSVNRYGGDETLRQVIDEMHAKLHCCGADGYGDWTHIFWVGNASVTSRRELAVPASCCDRAAYSESQCVTSVPGDLPEVLTVYKRGCSSVLKQHLRYAPTPSPKDVVFKFFRFCTTMWKMSVPSVHSHRWLGDRKSVPPM